MTLKDWCLCGMLLLFSARSENSKASEGNKGPYWLPAPFHGCPLLGGFLSRIWEAERLGRGEGLGDGSWEGWEGGGEWEANNKTPGVAECGHPSRYLKVMGLKFHTKILLGFEAPGSSRSTPIFFFSFI